MIASLVAKITFVVAEISFKVDMIISAKITFEVADIIFKVVVIISSVVAFLL